MSKEIETIDTYIEQQTSQISELMQTVILLQTKVKMTELENKKLDAKNKKLASEVKNVKGINRVDLENSFSIPKEVTLHEELPIRNGVRTNLIGPNRTLGSDVIVKRDIRKNLTGPKRTMGSDVPIDRNLRKNLTNSKRTLDPVQTKVIINSGFTTRKGAPEE